MSIPSEELKKKTPWRSLHIFFPWTWQVWKCQSNFVEQCQENCPEFYECTLIVSLCFLHLLFNSPASFFLTPISVGNVCCNGEEGRQKWADGRRRKKVERIPEDLLSICPVKLSGLVLQVKMTVEQQQPKFILSLESHSFLTGILIWKLLTQWGVSAGSRCFRSNRRPNKEVKLSFFYLHWMIWSVLRCPGNREAKRSRSPGPCLGTV